MTDSSTFARLLKQQQSERERELLHNLRHELKLPADDPVWALLAVLEEFCCTLLKRSVPAAQPGQPDRFGFQCRSSQFGWLIALGLSAGGLLATTLMAISFYIGYRAAGPAAPPWLLPAAGSNRPLLIIALAIPAGWMLLAQALPILVYIACCGWCARKTEPFVGWAILVACAVMAVGSATTLCCLLVR